MPVHRPKTHSFIVGDIWSAWCKRERERSFLEATKQLFPDAWLLNVGTETNRCHTVTKTTIAWKYEKEQLLHLLDIIFKETGMSRQGMVGYWGQGDD